LTITITLAPDMERKLIAAAATNGLTPEIFAHHLIERGLKDSLDQVLAPFRKEVEESGITDDELRELFTKARAEVRAEKRAKHTGGVSPK
jgi:hypothetical protein